MHGEPELTSDFTHLPYANPDAPKGGSITFGEVGTFDNLNPFIIKGDTPWEIRGQTFESLLTRSWDEPFTLYASLAESVRVAEDRSWVEFTLNSAALFSDGAPVTVDDVIFSMNILSEKGRPPYRGGMDNIAEVSRIGTRVIRFTLKKPDRELPLILALKPILKQADWAERVFEDTTLTPLIGSGPYVVRELEQGRTITLKRNPDYWARDLPVNAGQHNLDEIRVEYFRDGNALFEAFKAGEISVYRDGDPVRWRDGYQFSRATTGQITREEIAHQRPSGMKGFVFNTRRQIFADVRVRQALTLAFDFEWMQRTLLAGAFTRIPSYFGNSELAHRGRAEGAERALLTPFGVSDAVLNQATKQPVTDGKGRNRRNMRRAAALLVDAGWRVEEGVLVDQAGTPFSFEIMLRFSSNEKIAGLYASALKKLGIDANIRLVDAAQHQARLVAYDFDMIVHLWALSLSPGAEQRKYWGSEGVTAEGTRNHAGIDSAAVDAAIDAMVNAKTREDLIAASRALDRVLTAGRYVVPFWYADTSRIAYDAGLRHPETTPIYGDWTGFLPDTWWRSAQ